MRTLLSTSCLLAILVNMPASAQRASQTAPMPNRTVAAPSSHRPPGDHPESTAGTIGGFVYWDASRFSHVPAGSCSGLAVTVAVGSSSGGPLVAYTPLATLTNNFKYAGQVKEFLAGGKVNVYDVCTYGYDHVPVGPDLQVKLEVPQPWVFSPVAVPQFAILGPIKIINAQCNMLPRITNPTVSDLFAHWGSCQNMAYDVNFVMHTAPRAQLGESGSGGITPANTASQRGMLSNSPQQGMLASAGSPNSGLLGNKGSAASVPSAVTPVNKVELNPQPLPPRTTAADGTFTPTANAALSPQHITTMGPACTVDQLELRIRTGNDDLRGGQNNLNVEVHFADGSMQVTNNVNHGANWGNNSTNVVTVPLQHPVSPNKIKMIRLVHLAQGGYAPPSAGAMGATATPVGPALAPIYAAEGIKSEDNWDLAEFQAFGRGKGIDVPIASSGTHRFTGSYPSLDINAQPGAGCPSANLVSKISFTFWTGNDDLRGGKDNLNITIHFADGTSQSEPNVNHGDRWPDGSTKGAEVLLSRAVTLDQIKSITLSDTFTGGSGGDNWNMSSMKADAWVGPTYHTIAQYGFHRFSSDWSGEKAREITIPTHAIN
ncbi:MAG TPA: hypothetical protein VK466_01230 [Terriglobales bacterium]|nr:hypothetical protein [Terriglobales bacterium]